MDETRSADGDTMARFEFQLDSLRLALDVDRALARRRAARARDAGDGT